MCGIVFYKDFNGRDVTRRVKARYQAQRQRGTEGFGYFQPGINRLSHNPAEDRLLADMLRHPASEVLFHHRFPTSTKNVQNACHPFSTNANKALFNHSYVLVHNGYLSNDDELKRDHEALGIKYISDQPDGRFNDSEALLYDVAFYLEGKQTKLMAQGAIAFVVIERDETGKAIKLHWARNSSSPLQVQYKPGKLLALASEGKGLEVAPHQLNTFDYATGVITTQELTVNGYTYTSLKRNDDNYHWDYEDYAGAWPTSRDASRKVYRYNYYDREGTHWQATTDKRIEDFVCHMDGEDCPRTHANQHDEQISEYVEVALQKAEWDTQTAVDIADYELDLATGTSRQIQQKLDDLETSNQSEDVNEYVQLSDELETLKKDITIINEAAEMLAHLLDAEQENVRKLRIGAGITSPMAITEGEVMSEIDRY